MPNALNSARFRIVIKARCGRIGAISCRLGIAEAYAVSISYERTGTQTNIVPDSRTLRRLYHAADENGIARFVPPACNLSQ